MSIIYIVLEVLTNTIRYEKKMEGKHGKKEVKFPVFVDCVFPS